MCGTMLRATFKALGDLLSPEFRAVLLKAIGLTLALFIGVIIGVELLLSSITFIPWGWVQTLAQIGTGLGLVVAFFFLMSPVTAVFAGLYLDRIAALVETKHYPNDHPGTPLSGLRAMMISMQFALIVLLVNLAVLPLVFTGIGIFALVAANAYLLSREYFEMVAMRHVEVDVAKQFRKDNAVPIFVAGLVPALLAIIPLVNLVVPLFATSYFVHIFKQTKPTFP
jgi:CysZ protein